MIERYLVPFFILSASLFSFLIYLSPWFSIPSTLFLATFVFIKVYQPTTSLESKIADQESRIRSLENKLSFVVTQRAGQR